MSETLIIECSEQMTKFLDALRGSGLYGPSRETVAQRLLEQKIWEMSQQALTGFLGKKP